MKTQAQINNWIRAYLANLLGVEIEEINDQYEFERFGINSSAAVSLVGDLEEWLDVELSPSLFFEFNTIAQVSNHLAQIIEDEETLTSTIRSA
jgi:acyl carrier protein